MTAMPAQKKSSSVGVLSHASSLNYNTVKCPNSALLALRFRAWERLFELV